MRHKSGARGSGSEQIIRTIKSKTRRQYSAEEKIRIVLDGLRGEDTIATKIDVYFCDPQPPWQRGRNENTNRLLRQYFPKGIDISGFSQAKLSATARRLNERPRKTLQYQTPAEKFEACVAATR